MNSQVSQENNNPAKNKKDLITTVLIFVLSAVSALVGALILFIPQISPAMLCDIFCGCLIILGIVMIAKFFAGKAFQKFHDYSFALGVLLVVMGCIGFVRVGHLTENLDMWVGFIVLCIGIFMLQCSIQLKLLNSPVWIADIILTVLIMISAILVLVYWKVLLDALPEFPFWSVLIAGIINIINFPVVLFTIKSRKDHPEKAFKTDKEVMENSTADDSPAMIEAADASFSCSGTVEDTTAEVLIPTEIIDAPDDFSQDL